MIKVQNIIYRIDSRRRLKQLFFIFCRLFVVLFKIYYFWIFILEINHWIGIKILLFIYSISLIGFYLDREKNFIDTWISLHPFDLK